MRWSPRGSIIFKQKTAYEIRPRDWSSDVCSSDLGEQLTITLRSDDFDAWLVLDDPNGPMFEHDDDSAGGTDSRLTVTLPPDGRYVILANVVQSGKTGSYTLTLSRGK